MLVFFFFSSRRRHTRCSRDWSSDVCSSDLRGTTRSVNGRLAKRPTEGHCPADAAHPETWLAVAAVKGRPGVGTGYGAPGHLLAPPVSAADARWKQPRGPVWPSTYQRPLGGGSR